MEHAWEQSKENAAPLATGRSIASLSSRPFGASSEDEAKTKKYEKLVRRSERAAEWLSIEADRLKKDLRPEDDLSQDQIAHLRHRLTQTLGYQFSPTPNDLDHDPLRYWILYIKHIRTAHPSDTQRQFLLMERCARTFLSTPFLHHEYSQDARLIRTCILYADKTSSPNEVFKRMNSLGVGKKVALFWVAWAWLAEKRQDYSFCEKIFQKALRVGAEPKKFLVEREKQFLRRMSRHWLNTSRAVEELDEEEENGGGRGALNSLNEERVGDRGVGGGVPPRSFGSRRNGSGSQSNQPNTKAGFDIFQDENSPDRDAFDDENRNGFRLTKECERTKENKMRAEQWNERGYGLEPPAGGDSIVSTRGAAASYAAAAPTPAFDVYVDEEFENDDDAQKESKGKEKVDDRSLRQRLDGGTAERLHKDPLRYMKNPSKIASDQEKYDPAPSSDKVPAESERPREEKQSAATSSNKAESKQSHRGDGYNKELVEKDDSGEECCFEEHRGMCRHYTLVLKCEDYNSLKRQEEDTTKDSSQMDVEESIDEVDMEEVQTKCTQRLKSALKPPSSSLRTKANDPNISVVNPRRVLFGTNTEFPNESVNTSTASSQLNGSFVRDREETINTKFANAEISMMFCSPNNDTSKHQDRSFMASTCKQPLFSTSRKVAASAREAPSSSFAIFQDENDAPAPGTSFAIFQDDGDEDDTRNAAGTSFAIFQDDENDVTENHKRELPPRSNAKGSFAIFQDNTKEIVDNSIPNPKLKRSQNLQSNGQEETATMSALNDVLECDGLDFDICSNFSPKDSRPPATRNAAKPSTRAFSKMKCSGDDATASLSDIGAVLGELESCSIKGNHPKEPSGAFTIFSDEDTGNAASVVGFAIHEDSSPKSTGLGFEMFTDENTTQKKRKAEEPTPCFGDISRIEGDDKAVNFDILDENEIPCIDAIDYLTKHKSDKESAMRQCMLAASKSSNDLQIFDYRKRPLPKEFLRKSFMSGIKIDLLGGGTATIIHELGRGVHGVVLLCTVESDSSEESHNDALKIQAPIGSLAHEYATLLKLEERVDLDDSGFYPFPQPQSLYAFSEGGLFVMTAGSDSGMTLVDVVNTYNESIGNVPELVAVYYTSRMLRHLECLHRGKILHCDVKPDNWVLTSSPNENDAGNDAIAGADLMLVDFGRAVDLEKVTTKGSDPLKTVFSGSAAAEDMECRAMRQGQPWGVDLDFFGLCASSYILLFGSHIEVVQDKASGKLRLKKLLRRYWQRDLWQNYFDTLLNFDARSDDYCLRDLRMAFDEYIDGKDRKREIVSRVSTLYNHLPKKR